MRHSGLEFGDLPKSRRPGVRYAVKQGDGLLEDGGKGGAEGGGQRPHVCPSGGGVTSSKMGYNETELGVGAPVVQSLAAIPLCFIDEPQDAGYRVLWDPSHVGAAVLG